MENEEERSSSSVDFNRLKQLSSCPSLSPEKIQIYEAGDAGFIVFNGAERLLSEFRMLCQSIHCTKTECSSALPTLPVVLLPEQAQVLLESGFAQIRRIVDPEQGSSTTLTNDRHSNGPNCDASDDSHFLELAQHIIMGRKIKAQKRTLLGPDVPSGAIKVRKLDMHKFESELKGLESGEEHMEQMDDSSNELEQTVEELRKREEKRKNQGMTRQLVEYDVSESTSLGHIARPSFPESGDYSIKLTVFRDLWRKGFYLARGTKFGCDYLAYEKPPGKLHSRFMVLCTSANDVIRPLNLIGVSRVGTQVKKQILLAMVSPGAVVPYYVEMNWWKGDGRKQ